MIRTRSSYPEMAKEAVTKALLDAGLKYDAVEQAVVGYCYGDSTCGQRAVRPRCSLRPRPHPCLNPPP